MSRIRVHIRTVGHVLSELNRQYRRADRGDLEWTDASHAARILREMRHALEGDALERRIAALEQALAERDGAPPPRHINGNGRYAAPR